MASEQDGRWDVSIKSDAVCLERVSDGDKRLFEDLLAPEEARELAGLLTKFADKLGESGHSDRSGDSDKGDASDGSEKSRKSNDSEKSDETADAEDSEDKSSE
ncbi:hypothetical protein [Mycobacterium sp.]|uniref:hypothetical protein n=1 Tax=Mycobacterium sp. TaxID=1785 RepID=UPI0025DBF89F|nr:hypothetical protein [Mycobacterium sp.]MBW0012299.1 hypothetical protein [Mycobacterium sp.]